MNSIELERRLNKMTKEYERILKENQSLRKQISEYEEIIVNLVKAKDEPQKTMMQYFFELSNEIQNILDSI